MQDLKIGNLTIKNPVILAPMAGITDSAFRKIVKKFGCGYTVSEMIASRAILLNVKNEIKKMKKNDSEYPMAIQIAGFEPDVMAEAAIILESNGADIIDLNFGCPVKKVVNGYAGSALMKDADLSEEIMKSVANAVKIPVTIKMRKGWDDVNQNALEICKIAEDCGVKMATIHGRTRAQMYNGRSDWEFIASIKQKTSIPIIANGDIKTMEDAKNVMNMTKVDGIMIGRGIYGKPWLLSQMIDHINGKSVIEIDKITKLNTILEHLELIENLYDERNYIGIARKHLGFYSHGMDGSANFRKNVNFSEAWNEIIEYTMEFFG